MNMVDPRDESPAGSVKKARERAAADLARDTPMPSNSTKTSPSHSASPSIRSHISQKSHSSEKNSSPPKGGLLSSLRKKSPSPEAAPAPEQAPERPPRPNGGPPLLQSNSFTDSGATINPRRARNYWEDGNAETGYWSSSRPSTTATGSSTASIPDFPTIPSMPSMPSTPTAPSVPPVPPIPQMPIPTYPLPRRNLGPPPSARRGASSYYSQTSYVPPIPEEMSDHTRSSYASSHVIPTNSWGDGPPGYYITPDIEEEDEVSTVGGDSGRESRAGDHTEESNLVKKGSPEKRFQPYMDTVESGDESDFSAGAHARELDWQAKQDQRWRDGEAPSTDPIGRHNFQNSARLQHHPYSGYESDATFLDSPRSGSPGAMHRNPFSPKHASPCSGGPSPITSPPPIDPRVDEILGNLEKGGAITPSATASPHHSNNASFSEKQTKRPPRLNLESAKNGVPRGSASSLPDLIKRATRLASNLDRGKTASRIGMLDLLNANDKEKKEKGGKTLESGSMADILASFPSPSPTVSTYQKPSTYTSVTPHGKSNLSRSHTVTYSSTSDKPRGRRCCGIPLWAFILLSIILFLLIVAAVIIPVTLVVIPRSSGSSGNPTKGSCEKSNQCHNGGTSIVVDKQCRCVCAGGWTGASCTSAPVSDGSCTTTDIPGSSSTSYRNATLGSDIPRLITFSQSNFSLPLSGPTIASYFASTNLSCASENALVGINSKVQPRSLSQNPQAPIPLSLGDVLGADAEIPSRASSGLRPTHVLEARASAQTSNEIIFADPTGASSGSNSNSTASSTNSSSSASPSSTSSSTASVQSVTTNVLDFARTAILFIMQERDLDTAKDALDHMQLLLDNGDTFDASQTTTTGNITVNWMELSVSLGNGTKYGDKGGT